LIRHKRIHTGEFEIEKKPKHVLRLI
jgi:hypothetical protein